MQCRVVPSCVLTPCGAGVDLQVPPVRAARGLGGGCPGKPLQAQGQGAGTQEDPVIPRILPPKDFSPASHALPYPMIA